MLFADLLSLHLVTFLMFFILVTIMLWVGYYYAPLTCYYSWDLQARRQSLLKGGSEIEGGAKRRRKIFLINYSLEGVVNVTT